MPPYRADPPPIPGLPWAVANLVKAFRSGPLLKLMYPLRLYLGATDANYRFHPDVVHSPTQMARPSRASWTSLAGSVIWRTIPLSCWANIANIPRAVRPVLVETQSAITHIATFVSLVLTGPEIHPVLLTLSLDPAAGLIPFSCCLISCEQPPFLTSDGTARYPSGKFSSVFNKRDVYHLTLHVNVVSSTRWSWHRHR